MLPIIHQIVGPIRRQTKFASVGTCIYCPRGGPPEVALTDEHIIPDGLGGDLVLPDSSCLDCARHTCKIETVVMRQTVHNTRGALGLKSRKKRPKQEQEIFDVAASPRRAIRVPFDNKSPAIMNSFVTDTYPGILGGVQQDGRNTVESVLIFSEDIIDRLRSKVGLGEFEMRMKWHPLFLAQMVAKIAHAFTVAHIGLENFNPMLPSFILAKEKVEFPSYLIGSLRSLRTSNDAIHRIRLYKRSYAAMTNGLVVPRPVFVVDLQLFARVGAPVFVIATGFPKA